MNAGSLPTVRTVAALRARMSAWRTGRVRTAFVPTMGALHEGHLSLIRLGRQNAERVVASIFVNPTQFGPNEDLDAYPRREAEDAELLRREGCDLLFAPSAAEMYPPGFATEVRVSHLTDVLCGAARPGHFGGVATVVAKLLILVSPEVAVFGEKDYQQLLVIRRMARDLDLPTTVIGAPIARAEDGLALSSRNAYLSEPQRRIAGRLNKVVEQCAALLRDGGSVERVETQGRIALEKLGFDKIDYLEVRGAEDLASLGPGPLDQPARVFVAAWLANTRLIDNWPV